MAKIGSVNAPLIPTAILITGGYIAWFAVHYWRDTTQVYPSGPVKAVLTGKGMPAPIREGSAQDPNAAAIGLGEASSGVGSVAGSLAAQNAGTAAAGAGAAAATGASPPSGNFTQSDMVSFWSQLGGDPGKATFAAGVMNAESGGDPTATSSNPNGGTNVGLFQLDTKGVGSGHTIEELKDPTLNTQITIMATRNGTDWADWADPYVDAHGTGG